MSELSDYVDALTRIAREAGQLVMRGYRRDTRVTKKGEIDLVTEYDLASEALITEQLARALPGLPVVGEEAQGKRVIERGDEGLRLFVDPIDGTTNFAHGHPFFAVSLGLCRGGTPLAGVIYAPALDLLWSGAVGEGAFRNGEACRVSASATLRDALCATGFGYDVVGAGDDNVAEFRLVQSRCRAVRRCGAAAIDLALVADGTYDGYWEFMLQPWDVAAGAALVLAAGGRVSDFDDRALDVHRGAVVASNRLVHAPLRETLAEVRRGKPVPTR